MYTCGCTINGIFVIRLPSGVASSVRREAANNEQGRRTSLLPTNWLM